MVRVHPGVPIFSTMRRMQNTVTLFVLIALAMLLWASYTTTMSIICLFGILLLYSGEIVETIKSKLRK